jgi:cephalosporin hydroxylase
VIGSLATTIERMKRTTGASVNCGWMCDEVAFLLYALVKFYKPELVIQTGHLWGKSACVVLEAMTDGFLSERGGLEIAFQNADLKFTGFVRDHTPKQAKLPRMISVDPEPMGVPKWQSGIDLLKRLHPDQFDFRQMTSVEFFASFKEDLSGTRLMGIVDGDHSPEGCLMDLQSLDRLGASLIVVDDTNWLPKLKTVAHDFAAKAGYAFFNFEPYNGVGVLTRQR